MSDFSKEELFDFFKTDLLMKYTTKYIKKKLKGKRLEKEYLEWKERFYRIYNSHNEHCEILAHGGYNSKYYKNLQKEKLKDKR